MKNRNLKSGWTLIELLMALMVSSIILAAVATFAAAISSANTGADDIQQKQARIRTATVRLNELIKYSKIICYSNTSQTVIWTKDKDSDLQIDTDELMYIDIGSGGYIKIIEFYNVSGVSIAMYQIRDGSALTYLMANAFKSEVALINGCSNAEFGFDNPPPAASFMSIKFDYPSYDKLSSYEINAKTICSSVNLLDSYGELVTKDDD